MLARRAAMKIGSLQSLALGLYFQRELLASAFITPSFTRTFLKKQSLPVRSFQLAAAAKKMERPFETWTYDEPCKTMAWSSLAEADITITSYSKEALDDSDLVLVGIMAPPKDESSEDDEDEEKDIDTMTLTGAAKELDDQLGGALSDLLVENAKAFKNGAKAGSTTPIARIVTPGSKAKRYAFLGLGKTPKEDAKDPFVDAGKTVGKTVAGKCDSEKKVATCSVILPEVLASNEDIVADISTSFYESLYADNRYRTGSKAKKPAEDLKLVKILSEGASASETALDVGKKLASGVIMTKDIVNAPHNVLNAISLANTAKLIAKESGGTLTCTILDKNECEKRGMGAFLGVARGSEVPPQFIHLTYKPPSGNVSKKVGVIGKGLLFDTGGYNIKTQMMELMKFDCGGSAAILGAARAIGALAPDGVEAHFCVAACDNMINGKGMVPSDILTASNGKTIEVMNTDAEGRLTLADALVYADKELGCESIIELSTLTGACMISLGKKICGVWTDNDDLGKELEEVSKVTGDKSWRMPMAKEYNDQLESKFADIKNIGTRYGGAITAALFLQNFVDKKKPFAHIDIAGPVWDEKDGATGFGAKLVSEWIKRQGQK